MECCGVLDVLLLIQVMLYAEGFTGAKDLASKMVSLFLLSRQLLSQQQVCLSIVLDNT